ncbi:MAG: AAA family ATPase, partial [bacterium]
MNSSLQKRLAAIEAGEGAVSKEKSVSGEIATLYFSSPEFSAGILQTSDYQAIKFSGKFMVNIGDRVKFFGRWIEHPKFGWQFEARSFEHDLIMDAEGLAHYLNTNPNFLGIGPVKAEKIARAFAGNFDQVITKTPEKIRQTAGLSEKQLTILRVEWEKRKRVNSISSWLGKFGLTHNQVEKLTTKYGDGVKSILETNPYVLYREVDGYGFYRADQIALKLGYEKNHPGRIQSAILYTVDQQTQNGDCWTEERVLIELVGKALALDCTDWREVISKQLNVLLEEDHPRLYAYQTSGRSLVANLTIYQREKELFEKFSWCAKNPPDEDMDSYLSISEDKSQAILDCLKSSQKKGVYTALTNRISAISGSAGSGKSFTISTVNQLCEEGGLSVAMCAPTGKAAKRMEDLSGWDAYTIHRLLDYSPLEGWRINRDNPLEVDVVIVDEFSMVDVNLAWHLFDAIDLERTKVILVGDHNQLPPVGPGNLLRDLLDRKIVPVVILDQVIRQAGILKENSTTILSGQVRPTAPGTKGLLRPWYVIGNCNRET